jgi:hypothetical protein
MIERSSNTERKLQKNYSKPVTNKQNSYFELTGTYTYTLLAISPRTCETHERFNRFP